MDFVFKLILSVAFLVMTVSAMYDGEAKEIKCKGEVIKNAGTFHTNIKICVGEFLKAKADKVPDRKKGFTCLLLCALTKEGIFDATGTYDETKMNSAIDTTLSPEKATMLKEETATCVKANTGLSILTEDKVCANYKPLFKCFRSSWLKTCMDDYDSEFMEEE